MDDIGKSIPEAGEPLLTEEGPKSKSINEFCLNCDTRLQDSYCHHCGQKDIPRRQTLSELWDNFISSFWSYEGKFFRTTRYLITKPGFLAVEYNAGKRESYYHPARMYVFISFVFFLIFFSATDEVVELSEEDKIELENDEREQLNLTQTDSIRVIAKDSTSISEATPSIPQKRKGAFNFNFDDFDEYKNIAEYDSIQLTKSENDRDNWIERIGVYRSLNIKAKFGNDTEKYGNEFGKVFLENFSKVLFFLMPFFALLFKLLYLRRGYYYSEHLVFSIYYYNFFYFAGSLQLLIRQVSWLAWLSPFIILWIILYLLFAMKRMYAQGWGKTIIKYLIFGLFFICLLSIAFLIYVLTLFFLI